jgi:hypothetical protein
MYLKRNFVWTLNLSDRELKLIIKLLQDQDDLTDDDQNLADKLAISILENATRQERISTGRKNYHK